MAVSPARPSCRWSRRGAPADLPLASLPARARTQTALSRIGNWAEMDELERARVLRVLGARNKVRLEDRKAQLDAEDKLKQEQAQ